MEFSYPLLEDNMRYFGLDDFCPIVVNFFISMLWVKL